MADHPQTTQPTTTTTRRRYLTAGYRESYYGSDGIAAEHAIDAGKILQAFQAMPGWWAHLQRRTRIGWPLTALDVGAGEAAKSLLVLDGLRRAFDLDGAVLHANESDPAQLREIARRMRAAAAAGLRVQLWPFTYQALLEDHADDRVLLDPPPGYATALHVAYYLPQEDGRIPTLAALPDLVAEDGLVAVIVEGPGQLQDLKWHLHRTRGLPPPVGVGTVQATLRAAGIPFGDPPILIPNHAWTVDKTLPPEVMFRRSWRFLLDGNWGSRDLVAPDLEAGGRWVQANAHLDPRGTWRLDAPDALLIAGRWLAGHPTDAAALAELGHRSGGD